MSEPRHVLPPASTTKVDLRTQAAGFFAQRRSNAPSARPAPIPEAVREIYGDVTPEPDPEPLQPAPVRRTFTTAQLVEHLRAAKTRKRAIVESGDPDGPEDVGWDPSDIARGANLAAGALAHQKRRQR